MADFVGRERDLEQVQRLLAGGERLVTLFGPAGIGKTRLAQELLRREEGLFVPLAGARSAEDVVAAAAGALGLSAASGPTRANADRVARAVREREQALFVLDNFEQIAPLASGTLGRWLAGTETARFVVTSREVLRLPGEWVHELKPLGLPRSGERPEDADAVRLLVSLTRRASGGSLPDDGETLEHLAEIARTLEGIPLALELAARRVAIFGAAAVRARLGTFLDFFADGQRAAPARQRTLRDALAWSFCLLSPEEQAAAAQCSVFAGSFGVEAAEAVLVAPGGVVDLLVSLREKSLLAADEADPARFRLLLPVREFVREHLGEAERAALAARHADYYLGAAERLLDGARRGAEPPAELFAERENLQAVLEHALAERPATEASTLVRFRALRALAPLVLARGPVQPFLAALEEAAEGGVPEPFRGWHGPLRARLLRRLGRTAEAEALFRDAIEAGAAPPGQLYSELAFTRLSSGGGREAVRAWARARRAEGAGAGGAGEAADLVRVAFVLRESGDYDEAEALAAEALSDARRPRRPAEESIALTVLSIVASDRGAADEALRLGERAAERASSSASRNVQAMALSALSVAALVKGDAARFERHVKECQALAVRVGFVRLEAGAHLYLGVSAWEQGDLNEARTRLEDALGLFQGLGDRPYVALALSCLGAIDADEDAPRAAARRFAELPPADDRPLWRAIEVNALHLELAEARRPGEGGHARRAEQIREAVRARLAEPPRSYDELVAARICGRVLEHGGSALEVRAQGALCTVGALEIDLRKHAAARALLLALARAHLAAPGRPLSWDELAREGWPGERILPAAAKNRVKVAVAGLRKAGLREMLLSDERGYFLRPDLRVSLE